MSIDPSKLKYSAASYKSRRPASPAQEEKKEEPTQQIQSSSSIQLKYTRATFKRCSKTEDDKKKKELEELEKKRIEEEKMKKEAEEKARKEEEERVRKEKEAEKKRKRNRNKKRKFYQEEEEKQPQKRSMNNPLHSQQKEQSQLMTILQQISETTDLAQAAETIIRDLKTEEDVVECSSLIIQHCLQSSESIKMYVKLISELLFSYKLNSQIQNGSMVFSQSLINNVSDYYYKKLLQQYKRIHDMSHKEMIELEEKEQIEKNEFYTIIDIIGELYLQNIVNEMIPLICMNELVEDPTNEIKLEAYCRLCTKVFDKIRNIDNLSSSYEEMKKVYNHANTLKDDQRLSKRMQSMMLDVVQMINSHGN